MKIASPAWIVRLGFLMLLSACGPADPPPVEQVASAETEVADPYRLSPGVVPLAQQLMLQMDPAQTDYSGQTTITINVESATAEIRLHAEDMQIDTLSLSQGDRAYDVSYQFGEEGLLNIASAETLSSGTYELHIEFSNNFNTDGSGIYRTEMDGQYYISSQFEATDARKGFPCFDEPGFKFPWQLTITVPEDQLAITNTPEVSSTAENGRVTTVFDSTPALPSYLIAVAAGDYEAVPIEGMSIPGRVIVPRGKTSLAAWAVEITPPILAYLEEYFGEAYPFKKLDLVAADTSFAGAMEHPGAITYSDYLLLLDDTASSAQVAGLIKTTAHELAHQWFGNLVTMQWWDDLWLNESFADWMGDKTVEAVYPEYGADLSELAITFQIMDSDARPTTIPIRHRFKSNDNFFDGVILSYYKGKTVINMFETAAGSEVFRDGVVRYLRKYSRANAVADDLWLSISSGADFNLAAGMATFIDQPGIPLVTVTSVGSGDFVFSQSRLLTGEVAAGSDALWMIPVAYSYLSADGLKTGSLILKSKSQTVHLGEGVAWIEPNADQGGYYRWNIPADMLAQLGKDASAYLNVRERMGLLSNLWALLSTRKITAPDFMRAMAGVASDQDPAVIYAMLGQLNNVRRTFITPELRQDFAAYVSAVLMPTFDRIGAQAIPDESVAQDSLRPQLLGWLADYGQNERAQAITNELAQKFLAEDIPASNLVDVSLRGEARRGGLSLYKQALQKYESASTPGERQRYLGMLGSFRDPEVVARLLDYMLSGAMQASELATAFQRLAAWTDNNGMLLGWLIEHDAELRETLPAEMMAFIPGAMATCSPENLPTILEFYGAPEREVPGIERNLKDAEAEVMECWELRQREVGRVGDYLKNYAR